MYCICTTIDFRVYFCGRIPTIAFFLGHKFLGSSLTYLHSTKEHLEEVIAKLER